MSGQRKGPGGFSVEDWRDAWLLVRGRLYRVGLAVVALAAGYGLVTDTQAALWVALVTAVAGNGMAVAFTPATARAARRADLWDA
jgi:hypothetical protein